MSSATITSTLIQTTTSNVLSAIRALGFDIDHSMVTHKIDFNFAKPNLKAFEMIAHFLLTQIDPDRATKCFASCWPILIKEQEREFREILFTWLIELSSANNAAASSSSTLSINNKTTLNNKQTLQINSLATTNNIKFPLITKSLLMSPGGIKICELLFVMTQLALVIRVNRLFNESKASTKIWPKVNSLFIQSNGGGDRHFSLNTPQSNSRIITTRQLAQWEIYRNSLRNRLDIQLNELNQSLATINEIKTNSYLFIE
jgi:hypothetical protein